jgi:hypothetical protein
MHNFANLKLQHSNNEQEDCEEPIREKNEDRISLTCPFKIFRSPPLPYCKNVSDTLLLWEQLLLEIVESTPNTSEELTPFVTQ